MWKCSNGIADTIRKHLASQHGDEWQKMVQIEKLKGWDKIGADFPQATLTKSSSGRTAEEPFTLDGFHHRLTRWIVVDDQVSS